MADNIKWAFGKMVIEVNWMDEETKNVTLRKLANTKSYFGYPDNYTDMLNSSFEEVRKDGFDTVSENCCYDKL